MIGALFLLLGCQLVGETLRDVAHVPVPGPVIGMLLLTAILIVRPQSRSDTAIDPVRSPPLERVADALISRMGLLFVPAGVGVIAQASVLKTQWLPILGGMLGSTLLGLVVTALVMKRFLPESRAKVEDALLAGGTQ
jgi:holin-like protein